MKKTIVTACVALMLTATGFAQEKTTNKSAESMQSAKIQGDNIMMKDGKVWTVRNGQATELTQNVTLSDGTTVSADGTVQMKNGKSYVLKNGESISSNGTITPTPGTQPPIDQRPPNPTPPPANPPVPPVGTTPVNQMPPPSK